LVRARVNNSVFDCGARVRKYLVGAAWDCCVSDAAEWIVCRYGDSVTHQKAEHWCEPLSESPKVIP